MKKIVLIFILFVAVFAGTGITTASAQCAMCTINAEQGVKNGNTQAKGINSGVMYLMAIPYLMFAGLGILWYKKYRVAHTSKAS
ncbi:hypothetical protein [Pedobacter sp. L105]|uniref:hypothetical protein n=1 Tax=Pedobacter sp. L105 TaxID=1641871 RepID=UPI00131E5241|nr:hypothetical protein [Pedobacter sp. L105]